MQYLLVNTKLNNPGVVIEPGIIVAGAGATLTTGLSSSPEPSHTLQAYFGLIITSTKRECHVKCVSSKKLTHFFLFKEVC